MGGQERALDGTVGGDLDPGGVKKDDAANEDNAPTRVEQLLKNNQPELKMHIVGMVKTLNEKQAARTAINQEIVAVLSNSEAKGMNRKGVKAALKYLDLSESDRDAFLLTFRIVLEAMGKPIQQDLFLDTAEFNQDHQE